MKRFSGILFWSFLLCSAHALGHPGDSTVEIRLELIQETFGRDAKELALGISIINHTSGDVYIPGWNDLNVLLYKKKNGVFVPDTLDNPREDFAPPMFLDETNTIFSYFPDRSDMYQGPNPNLSAFCKEKGYSLIDWQKPGHHPMFLHAHEVHLFTLSPFRIIGLNHILNDYTEYKIAFSPAAVPKKYRPRRIRGYRRCDQASIQSNILYYQTLPELGRK